MGAGAVSGVTQGNALKWRELSGERRLPMGSNDEMGVTSDEQPASATELGN